MKISKNKLLATALVVMMTLVSTSAMFQVNNAQASYLNPNSYAYLQGVLGTDSYALYPFEQKSLDVGFSKYGELVNPTEPVGLRYGRVDPFANLNVSKTEWSEGWLMNCTYEYEGESRIIWAYALFSDFRNYANENWVVKALGPLDARTGFTGGRKTNGWATTAPMQVLYDGPRRVIVLLNTTIYDPAIPNPRNPSDEKGLPLVDLLIQVVFNKVKKYIIEIKDIKLRTESKLLEKVQVKFGQRGEWDLGHEPEDWMPYSYAHFYHELPTKYNKHPWYMARGYDYQYSDDTGYDLCQIIDYQQKYVAYAAYWPDLMSWRVEAISKLTREDKLTDVSDWETGWKGNEGTENQVYIASVPGYYQPDYMAPDKGQESSGLYYPDCSFPPYWTNAVPEVYVDGVKKTYGVHYDYEWIPGTPGGYGRTTPGQTVEAIPGQFTLMFTSAQADGANIYVHWKLHAEQDDMAIEAKTPYTMGEWVFDLSYIDTDLPTSQFRCVSVYGINDLNDGDDWDIGLNHDNHIDSETMYQLNEVFNPWDLRQAMGEYSWAENEYYMYPEYIRDEWVGKNTERWVQFFTGDGTETDFYLKEQIVVPDEPYFFPDWDEYCSAREKVLVNGKLQVPGDDYEIYWEYDINETIGEGPTEFSAGDSYPLMYPRILPGSRYESVWWEDENGNPTYLVYDYDYAIDYADGKLYLLRDLLLDKAEKLYISYSLIFPASYIQFYDESKPAEGAKIEVLYSTFRIVYKVDKFIAGIDGLAVEDGHYQGPWEEGIFILRYGPIVWDELIQYTVHAYPNTVTVMLNGQVIPEYTGTVPGWEWSEFYMYYDIPSIALIGFQLGPGDVIEVTYPIFAARYEWTTVGKTSAAVDSAGASMVTEGLRQWRNIDTKLAALDYNDTTFGPHIPFVLTKQSGTGANKGDYYDTHRAETIDLPAGRLRLKDNWCTKLPISSSNIIVVGGPYANIVAEYFNDFTDAFVPRVGTFKEGFYGPGCWGRNLYKNTATTGHAIISTYKDINGTIGFIVYGWSGDDTYYACYAIQHGLPYILANLQPGVTSIVLEFNYNVKPGDPCFFHVVECLGTFTECGGFDDITDDWMLMSTDQEIVKLVMNSYSSEFWVIHIGVDFTSDAVPNPWNLPQVYYIDVVYPQYIKFHWEARIHPDP